MKNGKSSTILRKHCSELFTQQFASDSALQENSLKLSVSDSVFSDGTQSDVWQLEGMQALYLGRYDSIWVEKCGGSSPLVFLKVPQLQLLCGWLFW